MSLPIDHIVSADPPFPMSLTVSRCDDWLSDGVLIAHRSLTVFGAIHAALPSNGVWHLGDRGGPRHCYLTSGLQAWTDELLRAPLRDAVLHIPDDGSTADPAVAVPLRWQWEMITHDDAHVFDGRIANAALHGRSTAWWWRLTFAWGQVPVLVGGEGDDRLFFQCAAMPAAALVGADR